MRSGALMACDGVMLWLSRRSVELLISSPEEMLMRPGAASGSPRLGPGADFSRAKAAAKTGKAPKAFGTGKRGRQNDPTSTSGQIRELLKTGMGVADIAKKLKCTPALVYNVKARVAAGGGAKAKRGPGRLPKIATTSGGFDRISGILDAVRSSERERSPLRGALERIQAVIAGVLDA